MMLRSRLSRSSRSPFQNLDRISWTPWWVFHLDRPSQATRSLALVSLIWRAPVAPDSFLAMGWFLDST